MVTLSGGQVTRGWGVILRVWSSESVTKGASVNRNEEGTTGDHKGPPVHSLPPSPLRTLTGFLIG